MQFNIYKKKINDKKGRIQGKRNLEIEKKELPYIEPLHNTHVNLF